MAHWAFPSDCPTVGSTKRGKLVGVTLAARKRRLHAKMAELLNLAASLFALSLDENSGCLFVLAED